MNYKVNSMTRRHYILTNCCSFRWTMLVALIGLAHISCFSQQTRFDSLMKRFDTYRSTRASEKLYAHFDQNLYLTGETMWFKLYLVDATLNAPDDQSRVAYVEIIDDLKRPVLQTKVAMKDGFGNGSIFLPASISSG